MRFYQPPGKFGIELTMDNWMIAAQTKACLHVSNAVPCELNSTSSECRRIRLLFVIFPILLFFGIWPTFAATESVPRKTTALENYVRFVSEPPVISRLDFEYREAGDHSNTNNYYTARWQTNGFFLRCFRSLGELQNAAANVPVYRAAGVYDDFFWIYSDENGLSRYSRTAESTKGEFTNGVVQVCKVNLDFLSQVMNLGIPNQKIASISWNNTNLIATHETDRGIVWKGYLCLSSNEIPTEMQLVAESVKNGSAYKHKIEYDWDSSNDLPRVFRHWSLSTNGNARLWETISVLKFEKSETLLPPSSFKYDSLTLENKRSWIYTNNGIYLILSGKSAAEPVRFVVPGSSDDPQYQNNRASRAAIIGVMVFLSVLAGIFLVRIRKS